jgi:hypothetical protein
MAPYMMEFGQRPFVAEKGPETMFRVSWRRFWRLRSWFREFGGTL